MLNKIKTKINMIISVGVCNFLLFITNINMVHASGFDDGAAKNYVTGWTTPFTRFLLWGIPIGAVIAIAVVVITYLAKTDPDEKEQMKPGKTIKKIIFWSIVGESVSAILAIVGL